jgi:hypothetical protein
MAHMTDSERDAWAEETLERIRRHQRRDVSGLWSMLNDDLADCLDALAVAPLLLAEDEQLLAREDYEARRLKRFEKYTPDWPRIKRRGNRGD